MPDTNWTAQRPMVGKQNKKQMVPNDASPTCHQRGFLAAEGTDTEAHGQTLRGVQGDRGSSQWLRASTVVLDPNLLCSTRHTQSHIRHSHSRLTPAPKDLKPLVFLVTCTYPQTDTQMHN